MIATAPDERIIRVSRTPSGLAQERILSRRGEPLFFADWMRVLMLHFEVEAKALQREVPFELDLYGGRAFITLVAFTMENMRPRLGGKLGALLFQPIATHDFLNVRTYVRHRGEPGIHFLAEWLSSWLAVQLGPRTFSLPYRHGHIRYEHDGPGGQCCGHVADMRTKAAFEYQAETLSSSPFAPCAQGSLDEWLMERYMAFNAVAGRRKFFRVWHPPWPQCAIQLRLKDIALLQENWNCFGEARLAGANFSPGLRGVWMGRPHCD
ncbi:MAG: DUF2071 domain-containing protein [Verrucomicrobiota bacterium]